MTPSQIKKIAEDRFTDACKALGTECYFNRFFDTSDIRQRFSKAGTAHLPKNPSDFVVTVGERMFYAEVKGTTTERFSFGCIEPSQLSAMMQQVRAGGEYFVFVNQVERNEWFVLPAHYILKSRELFSSIKLSILRKDYSRGSEPLDRFDPTKWRPAQI